MRLKYKKLILLLTMGVMGIGMVTISFKDTGKADATQKQVKSSAIYEAELLAEEENQAAQTKMAATPSPTKEPEKETLLELNAHPDINDVITQFHEAKLTCNEADFECLIKDATVIDMERLQRKIEYIKDYHNINCYTAPGINEIDYVVYVTYDLEFPVIETYAPSIDEFYIHYENGTPYIYFGSISNETSTYLNELSGTDEVVALIDSVNASLLEAVESDENLKEFYEKLSSAVESSSNSESDQTGK